MKTDYYLHTIDGQPAYFDGEQIVFVCSYGPPGILVNSLKQIRREQEASAAWRRSNGFSENFDYGYKRLSTPKEQS